jgi:hypothetical protein
MNPLSVAHAQRFLQGVHRSGSLEEITSRRGMTSIQSRPVFNRIFAVMAHTTRYAFKGESRLASDAGVSKSAVCRLLVKYPLFRQGLCGLVDCFVVHIVL